MGETRRPNGGPDYGQSRLMVLPDPQPPKFSHVLMAEWHSAEAMALSMSPGLLREQLLDVLRDNYSDALDKAAGVERD